MSAGIVRRPTVRVKHVSPANAVAIRPMRTLMPRKTSEIGPESTGLWLRFALPSSSRCWLAKPATSSAVHGGVVDLDALPTRCHDVLQTAVGLHDHQAAAEASLRQALLEITEVRAHDRADVGVRDGGRRALVLTVLPRQLVRCGDEQVRVSCTQDLAHADLMLRGAVGVQEHHGDGCDALSLQDLGYLARGILVERRELCAVG